MRTVILAIFLFPAIVFSQLSHVELKKVDSLKQIVAGSQHDTTKVKALKAWDDIIYLTDNELDFELNRQIDSVCTKNLAKKMNPQLFNFFMKAKSYANNNMGIYYHDSGDLDVAMDQYRSCLKISKKIGDTKMEAGSYNNIGNIYLTQEDTAQALNYYERALEIQVQIEDKYGEAYSLENIGIIHYERTEYEKALSFTEKSLMIKREIGDLWGESASLINLGNIHSDLGDNALALDHYMQALQIQNELGDHYAKSHTLNKIGTIYFFESKYTNALDYSSEALTIAQEINAAVVIQDAAHNLWQTHKELGNYKKSLEMHELYLASRDSIKSEENLNGVLRQEYKYQYELEATADSISHQMEQEMSLLEIKQKDKIIEAKRLSQYALFGGLFIVLILAIILFKRFKITDKQNEIIQLAHEELEVKNQEILDSIAYAKRIQSAVLPSEQLVKEYLKDAFILYKPKDIVAGDFYWLEHCDNKVLMAACDCTGHGVPGAMVSVFCSNGLNRSVREHGLTAPGSILDKTREIVTKEFEKSDENVQDGMDVALCSLEKLDNGQTLLEYAGAYNPLWIIRENSQAVEEIKANKQPIGKFHHQIPFTTHSVKLNKGDTFYVFTDGFADQFGGEKNKKFKSGNLNKLLVSITSQSMADQVKILDQTFEDWKGEFEQIDDVCVIGVRV